MLGEDRGAREDLPARGAEKARTLRTQGIESRDAAPRTDPSANSADTPPTPRCADIALSSLYNNENLNGPMIITTL
jgi:hypothetical protein